MGVTRRPHAPHRARRAGLDRHRGGGRRRGGSRPALRSDQLQLEGLEHGPGAVAHAELAEGERPLLARHWRARPRTPGALRRAGHPVDQTRCSSKALSTARVRSRTQSLYRMFDTWFLIVPSATPSELAISLLVKHAALRRRTERKRAG